MARTTVDAMLRRVRRQLHSHHQLEYTTLAEDLDTSETAVDVSSVPAGLVAGSIISVGLENMLVVSIASTTLTVVRGWDDSDPATALTGAEVAVNARYSLLDIYDAMVDEINSWGPNLYYVTGQEFTITSATEVVELPLAWRPMYGIVNVMRQSSSDQVGIDSWPSVGFRLQRASVGWTGSATSGLLIRLIDGVAAGKLWINVAMPFVTSAPAVTSSLIDDVRLSESYLDILAMGIKLRLATDTELSRLSRMAQDDPRRASETPVGSGVQPLQQAKIEHRLRMQAEIQKLRSQYPIMAM